MKKKINLRDLAVKSKISIKNMTIKTFHFNFLAVNTYVLYDETKEGIIIDPGNNNEQENNELASFIEKEQLKIKYIVNTHSHIDHVLGNEFATKSFKAKLLAHEKSKDIYLNAGNYGIIFGFEQQDFPLPDGYLQHGDVIQFGNQRLDVLYTPGHADGSICLLDKKDNLVFVGDLLFYGSIGRDDLPTGNHDTLMKSIKDNLLILNDDMVVFPGHGENTTIGFERKNNPYIQYL